MKICGCSKLVFIVSLVFPFFGAYAQNPHDLELGKSVSSRQVGGSNVVRVRSGNKENVVIDGDYGSSPDGKSHFGTLKVTSDNTINTTIDAHDGGKVLIGDVELSNIKSNSLEITTVNVVNDRIDVRGRGGKHELGTVRIGGLEGDRTTINVSNRIEGEVRGTKSIVSLGNIRIGVEGKEGIGNSFGMGGDSDQNDGSARKKCILNGTAYKKALELKILHDDLNYALVSECSYSVQRCNAVRGELKKNGWVQDGGTYLDGGKDSVEAVAFKNTETGKAIVAFRGTVPMNINDHLANITPYKKTDLEAIEKFSDEMVEKYGDVTFTGHSKGGGEALWASRHTSKQAVTFNHRPQYKTGELFESKQARGYYVKGEILSYIRFKDSKELEKLSDWFSSLTPHSNKNVIKGMRKEINRKKKALLSANGNCQLPDNFSGL